MFGEIVFMFGPLSLTLAEQHYLKGSVVPRIIENDYLVLVGKNPGFDAFMFECLKDHKILQVESEGGYQMADEGMSLLCDFAFCLEATSDYGHQMVEFLREAGKQVRQVSVGPPARLTVLEPYPPKQIGLF